MGTYVSICNLIKMILKKSLNWESEFLYVSIEIMIIKLSICSWFLP